MPIRKSSSKSGIHEPGSWILDGVARFLQTFPVVTQPPCKTPYFSNLTSHHHNFGTKFLQFWKHAIYGMSLTRHTIPIRLWIVKTFYIPGSICMECIYRRMLGMSPFKYSSSRQIHLFPLEWHRELTILTKCNLGKNYYWRKTRKFFFLPYSWYGKANNFLKKGRY